MIVSFNFYYAGAGLEDAVLRQRLRACEVRQNIGVARGRVLARTAGAADLPDVIWEHQFEDVAGHHADMAVRAASADFESIRAGMRKLCRRFERPLFEICGNPAPPAAASPHQGMVTLDWVFCMPEKAGETLELQRLAQRGPNHGRLLRLITPGNDLPDFMWQADGNAQTPDLAHAASAPRSGPQILTSQDSALIQRVEHSVWKVI